MNLEAFLLRYEDPKLMILRHLNICDRANLRRASKSMRQITLSFEDEERQHNEIVIEEKYNLNTYFNVSTRKLRTSPPKDSLANCIQNIMLQQRQPRERRFKATLLETGHSNVRVLQLRNQCVILCKNTQNEWAINDDMHPENLAPFHEQYCVAYLGGTLQVLHPEDDAGADISCPIPNLNGMNVPGHEISMNQLYESITLGTWAESNLFETEHFQDSVWVPELHCLVLRGYRKMWTVKIKSGKVAWKVLLPEIWNNKNNNVSRIYNMQYANKHLFVVAGKKQRHVYGFNLYAYVHSIDSLLTTDTIDARFRLRIQKACACVSSVFPNIDLNQLLYPHVMINMAFMHSCQVYMIFQLIRTINEGAYHDEPNIHFFCIGKLHFHASSYQLCVRDHGRIIIVFPKYVKSHYDVIDTNRLKISKQKFQFPLVSMGMNMVIVPNG